jgi:hypothetical protein
VAGSYSGSGAAELVAYSLTVGGGFCDDGCGFVGSETIRSLLV